MVYLVLIDIRCLPQRAKGTEKGWKQSSSRIKRPERRGDNGQSKKLTISDTECVDPPGQGQMKLGSIRSAVVASASRSEQPSVAL